MINFRKVAATIVLSLLLIQNTAMACGCKGKPRHEVYKPFKIGKYNQYYSALSHYYLQEASRLSSEGNETAAGRSFQKASKAQQGRITTEFPPRSSAEYKEISNARKLLMKYSTHANMGLYARQLAAAHFYYDKWVMIEKDNPTSQRSQNARTHFYKYINIIINDIDKDRNALTIDQSKHIERYFTKSNLIGTMYFPFDNSRVIINTDKKMIIDDAKVSVGKDYVLVVVGNADKVGTQEYNIKLSVKRAEAVRDKLIASGINPDDVLVVAFGENRANMDYGTLTYDNSANRRVEIYAIHRNSCGK